MKAGVTRCPVCGAPGLDPLNPKCVVCGAALLAPTPCSEPECMARQQREALEELARQSALHAPPAVSRTPHP